jgi:hypothetical protein
VSTVRFDRNPKFSCNSHGNQVKSDGFLLKKKMQIIYKGSYNNVTQEILVTLISYFFKMFCRASLLVAGSYILPFCDKSV